MLAVGSVAVSTSPVPVPLTAASPGSLALMATGNAVTLGGSGVTVGAAGPGIATIPAGQVVLLAEVGNVSQGGLYAISTAAATLSWFYGNAVT